MISYLPGADPDRTVVGRAVAQRLAVAAQDAFERAEPFVIHDINGGQPGEHPLEPFLAEAGFVRSSLGLHLRREPRTPRWDGTPRTPARAPRSVSSPFGQRDS